MWKLFKILEFLKLKGSPKELWKYFKQALKCCSDKCKNRENECTNPPHSDQPKNKNADKIQQTIKVLWFQYYKLFVVGYPKCNEDITLDSKSTDQTNDRKRYMFLLVCLH